MPNYDYVCPSCSNVQNHFHKMNEEIKPRCSECCCSMQKIISSGAGVHFKGSGFYETDYKNK